MPWVIDSVFLFESAPLLFQLRGRGVKIGMATSVRTCDWEAARIFPRRPASPLQISDDQVTWLSKFAPVADA